MCVRIVLRTLDYYCFDYNRNNYIIIIIINYYYYFCLLESNVTANIQAKVGRNLHLLRNHPINIISNHIASHFHKTNPGVFKVYDNLSPIVSTKRNFDDLLVLPVQTFFCLGNSWILDFTGSSGSRFSQTY